MTAAPRARTRPTSGDADLAEQVRAGHGVPSQDPDPAAQQPLSPDEAQREAGSVLAGGALLAGMATGAAVGAAVAGLVGLVVGASLGAVAGAVGSSGTGAATSVVKAPGKTIATRIQRRAEAPLPVSP